MNFTMVSHYRNYDTTQVNKISIQISFELPSLRAT